MQVKREQLPCGVFVLTTVVCVAPTQRGCVGFTEVVVLCVGFGVWFVFGEQAVRREEFKRHPALTE